MIQNITNKRERKRISATAARLCTEELAAMAARINIMDIGKLTSVAEDALASGRTQDGTREAIREWIDHNRTDRCKCDLKATDGNHTRTCPKRGQGGL